MPDVCQGRYCISPGRVSTSCWTVDLGKEKASSVRISEFGMCWFGYFAGREEDRREC